MIKPETSADIFERFRTRYDDKSGNIRLRVEYRDLLKAFGDPQDKMPPVFHVAGTNGKGSTCAYLRSILEAAGYKVHVYISPHLITVHERFRIAGGIISEAGLLSLLKEIEAAATPGKISYFEASTLAAFLAFARTPADFTIVEVGLGGRLDATNVVTKPLATLIARLSLDHREFLGETIDKIALEKAGIMRQDVPCFAMHQPDKLAAQTLHAEAERIGAPLIMEGEAFRIEERDNGFRFIDGDCVYDLPPPALLGPHQYHNAALAIAALSVLPKVLPQSAIAGGLKNVEWPARLQRLTGRLTKLIPPHAELWLDGGHNDSAGEVLAEQIRRWHLADGKNPRPLHVILGMLKSKRPDEFLKLFARDIAQLRTLEITGEPSFSALELAAVASAAGVSNVKPANDIPSALSQSKEGPIAPRILICGSLYLAGQVLEMNLSQGAANLASKKLDRAFTNLKLT